MYVYQLTHVNGISIKVIGYFGSWKKARQVMKKYRSQVQGFKEFPRCFRIKKLRVNQDDFYYGYSKGNQSRRLCGCKIYHEGRRYNV